MQYFTPSILYFACVMVSMYIGDAISNLSRGKIPQMFVLALIFLLAYLSGVFPKNIIDVSGVTTIYGVISSMILIHVGTLFDFRQLLQHYKVVLVTLLAMFGICLFCGVLGYFIYGPDTVAAALGPLTGGGMAAIIINQAAEAVNKPQLGLFATMIFIFHGFVGFPLTAWCLRKECINQLVTFSRQNNHLAPEPDSQPGKTILIHRLLPEKYRNSLFYLTQLTVLAVLADYFAHITGVNYSLIEIFIGIAFKYAGILENQPLNKSDSSTLLLSCLFASFMGGFANATLDLIFQFIISILILMATACVAIAVFCIPLGKKLGFSAHLSMAIGLNCFLGFPFNYALTNEAIRANAQTKEQADYLHQHLMPKMIVAGVVAVSLLSVVIAGFIASFYFHA